MAVKRKSIVGFARHQLGVPYVWGGESRAEGGFDCSGLIYAAYRSAGYKGIGRTTYQQLKQGVRVNPGQLRAGDLVFSSPHHVGLYVGNGMVISAPHTGAKVHTIPLSQFGGVYQARRLIKGGGGVTPPRGPVVQGPAGLPVPQHQAVQLSMPKLNFTPPAQAAVSALPGLPGSTMQPGGSVAEQSVLPGLPEVSQAPSPAGSLEAIRRRLIA